MADVRQVVESLFGRLAAFDASGVGDLFAEAIDWEVPGAPSIPWVGRRTRREQVPEFFTTMWSYYHLDQTKAALEVLIVEGSDAVALGRFSHVPKVGRPFSTPFAMHIRVEDGLITRLHLYEDTYLVAAALGV